MQSTRVWPTRHAELEFAGAVPWNLDGLYLLPQLVTGGTGTLVHGLRLRHGLPLWHTTLPSLEQLALLGSFTPEELHPAGRLSAAASGASRLSWQLEDRYGHVTEAGSVAMDDPSTLTDLTLTARHLVLLARVSEPARTLHTEAHRLGVAARSARSRVHWYPATEDGWPALLHASEYGESVVVDIARGKTPGARTKSLARWTLAVHDLSVSVQILHDLCIDWPVIHPPSDGAPCRYLYGVASQSQGDELPALVRFDHESGQLVKRPVGFARELGPPTLVPLRHHAREERGFLFAPCYDAVRDASELFIFDAERLERQPLASIRLPAPVRSELRGQWLWAVEPP